MKYFITLFAIQILFANVSISSACDKNAALQVDSMVKQMGTKKVTGNKVTFKWGKDWNSADSNQRYGLVRSVADSDACLTGYAREIKFYSPKGKLVGVASPETGISVY